MLSQVTVFCFFASYIVALGCEVVRAWRSIPALRWLTVAALSAGLTAHAAFLIERARATNMLPLLSSVQDWFLVVAGLLAALAFFFAAAEKRVPLPLFLLPGVLLLTGGTYLMNNEAGGWSPALGSPERTALRSWALLHATLLGGGMVAVAAGVVLSLMYLVQHRRLKHKRSGRGGVWLFSLESLSRWNRWTILAAVPLLSLGFAAGFLLGLIARQQGEPVSLWDPVIISSTVAWVAMLLIFARIAGSEHVTGRAVAVRTLIAFGLLLGTLLGLQLVTGGKGHGRPVAKVAMVSPTESLALTLSPRGETVLPGIDASSVTARVRPR